MCKNFFWFHCQDNIKKYIYILKTQQTKKKPLKHQNNIFISPCNSVQEVYHISPLRNLSRTIPAKSLLGLHRSSRSIRYSSIHYKTVLDFCRTVVTKMLLKQPRMMRTKKAPFISPRATEQVNRGIFYCVFGCRHLIPISK